MLTRADALPLAPTRSEPAALSLVPAALLLLATTFNALLAIVNGITPLTPSAVMAAELLIVAGAHIVAIMHYRREMAPWYALAIVMVFVAVTRSTLSGELDAKPLRDVLLIPTFVLLGMTFNERHLNRVVAAIHAVVLIVLVFEAVATPAYSALFKVQDYYINTRGYELESFWNKESDLFVSATRPDARFFAFVDLHRLSSIFLEPVSLGNYCMILTVFICARYRALGAAMRVFLIGGTVLALIGCDSRLAGLSSALIVAAAVLAPRLPRHTAVLYLPLVTGMAFFLSGVAGFQAGSDDLPGRIAHTVELLQRYEVEDFLALSSRYLPLAVDSGLAYLITTQSLIGMVVVWLFINFASREDNAEQSRYIHGLSVYLSLTMMVSFALLTIKTAGLLWFVHGVLQVRRPHRHTSRNPRANDLRLAPPPSRSPRRSAGQVVPAGVGTAT